MEVVNRLGGEGKMDAEELSRIFNDAGVSMSKKTFRYFDLRVIFLQTSDYLVVYLRLVTSGQLQKEEDFYQNFLEGGKSMREFCQQVLQ
jgi:ubiquitin thioesterase protein OTUB1